jgi:hypothetical protein
VLNGVEKAYIDKVHYSPYANEVIANEIFRIVINKKILN